VSQSPDPCPRADAPDVAVLVVSWNTRELLTACLHSLATGAEGLSAQVIVVDNASTDGSADQVRAEFPDVLLLANTENLGFVGGNNQAYAASDPRARYVLLLNSDAELQPGALRQMVAWMDAHPETAACGPLTRNTDGTLQPTWSRFPTVWSEMRGQQDRRFLGAQRPPSLNLETIRALPGAQPTDWVGGSCLLARRSCIDGPLRGILLDPVFRMYSEETDLCFRLKRAGGAISLLPIAEVIHHGGRSSRQMAFRTLTLLYRSKLLFFRRHYGVLRTAQLQAGLLLVTGLKWLVLLLRGRAGAEPRARQRAVLAALRGKEGG
jgi:GT2 family glycosyltransferase